MGDAGFSRSFTQIFPSSPTYYGRGIAEEVPLTPCHRHSPMDCHRQKNPVLSDEALMLALPTFLGRPSIVLAFNKMPVAS